MKVISFKVSEKVYSALKSKKQTFRSIFEPYAIKISQNSDCKIKYTGVYQTNSKRQYIDVCQIEKIIKNLQEIVEKIKKEED